MILLSFTTKVETIIFGFYEVLYTSNRCQSILEYFASKFSFLKILKTLATMLTWLELWPSQLTTYRISYDLCSNLHMRGQHALLYSLITLPGFGPWPPSWKMDAQILCQPICQIMTSLYAARLVFYPGPHQRKKKKRKKKSILFYTMYLNCESVTHIPWKLHYFFRQ